MRRWREANREKANAAVRAKREAQRRTAGVLPRGMGERTGEGKAKRVSTPEQRKRWLANTTHSPAAIAKRKAYKSAWNKRWRKANRDEYAAYHRRWRAAKGDAYLAYNRGRWSAARHARLVDQLGIEGAPTAPSVLADPKALYAEIKRHLPANFTGTMREDVIGEALVHCFEGLSVQKAVKLARLKVGREFREGNFQNIPIEKATWL
jgi:hypothetical protein